MHVFLLTMSILYVMTCLTCCDRIFISFATHISLADARRMFSGAPIPVFCTDKLAHMTYVSNSKNQTLPILIAMVILWEIGDIMTYL